MDIQLLCNGKRLAIVYDGGDIQQAFIVEQPLLKSYSAQVDNNLSPLYGKHGLQYMDFGRRTIDIDLSFIGREFACTQGKDLLVNMIDDYSIGDLFKIINHKIDERK